MPSTWTFSDGMPLDTVGSDGDLNFDRLGRFIWGPKRNGTWVGTANNVNPITGPNYGQAPGLAPASVLTGAQSTTPTPTVQPLGGAISTITPVRDSALIAVLTSSNVAGSFDVYNQTTGQVLVGPVPFVANATVYNASAPYPVQQYPLLAGNTYVIRVTGTGTGMLAGFMPIILNPASSLGQAVSSCGPVGFSANTTFTTTGQIAMFFGSTVPHYFRPPRAGNMYNIVATFTPTGTTTPANSVNIFMNWLANGSSTATYANFGKAFATGKPTILGTFSPTQYQTTNVAQYWFNINSDSTCTGTLQIDLQLVL